MAKPSVLVTALSLLTCTSFLVADTGTHHLEGPVDLRWAEIPWFRACDYSMDSMAFSPDGTKLVCRKGKVSDWATGAALNRYATIRWTDRSFAVEAYDETTGEMIWRKPYWLPPDQHIIHYPYSLEVWAYRASTLGKILSPDLSTFYVVYWSTRSHCFYSYGWPYYAPPFCWESRAGIDAIAYDTKSGEALWESGEDCSGPPWWGGTPDVRMDVSPDGGMLFVAGFCGDIPVPFVRAHDTSSGLVAWNLQPSIPVDEFWTWSQLVASTDGHTLIASGDGDVSSPLIVIDTTTGSERWRTETTGDGVLSNGAASGNRVFLVGSTDGAGSRDLLVRTHDVFTGEEIWETVYDGPGSGGDWGSEVAVHPGTGMLFVAGESEGTGAVRDMLTLGLDSSGGKIRWTATYDRPDTYDRAGVRGITVTPDGSTTLVRGWGGNAQGATHELIAYWNVLSIDIDIKPGSDENPINMKSNGVVPVAILGSEDLEVADIDNATLRFGPWEAAPAHDLGHLDTRAEHMEDVNGDGMIDLVVHFYTQESGVACGDADASLTGAISSGRPFEGVDAIRTNGCK